MKRFWVVGLAAVALFPSCARKADTGERIGVFTKNQTNPFFQTVRLGADSAAFLRVLTEVQERRLCDRAFGLDRRLHVQRRDRSTRRHGRGERRGDRCNQHRLESFELH